MELIKRTVLLHGGRDIHILIPQQMNKEITATHDGKGFYYMLSNGTGYSFMLEVFSLSITLENNEFIFIPFDFKYHEDYYTYFVQRENHFMGMVIFNYCTTQIDTKDILLALKTKVYKETLTSRINETLEEYIEEWKVRKRLTIKTHSSLLIISANGDCFTNMARSCAKLAEYGDDIKYNNGPPHMHHDWKENTSKSKGITFYYWQNEEVN